MAEKVIVRVFAGIVAAIRGIGDASLSRRTLKD